MFGAWSAASLVVVLGCMGALSACSMESRMGTGELDAAVDAGQAAQDSGVADAKADGDAQADAGSELGGGSLYAVGGTVSGLVSGASLTLQNNAGDNLHVSANGSFSFSTPLAPAESYVVTVFEQPSTPSQTCTVEAGMGTIDATPVTSVAVTCVTNSFSIGGTVSGMSESLVLQNNAADDLAIAENGSFSFATAVASASTYAVTILSGGPGCRVSGGTGTVVAGDVNSVTINCTAAKHTVGGTVSGLSGSGLIVSNGVDEQIVLSANGSFAFATPLASGSSFAVSVVAQPAGQTCSVSNGTGVMATADVTHVAVTCLTNTYSTGGALRGLAGGATIVLQNNRADDLSLAADGAFAFATKIAAGSSYNVSILTQPKGQACAVIGGSGTIGSSDVSSVVVNCAANSFTVGGSISGSTGTVLLRNNDGDDLELSANGSFAFSQPLTTGTAYAVTVHAQPVGQTCTVTNGMGKVGSANVSSVTVSCVTKTFTLGGAITGLTGTVTLANNGTNPLTRNMNGAYTFSGAVASGSVYSVSVKQQPVGQKCHVKNGVGVVGEANITDMAVTCIKGLYSIGGTATGLSELDELVLEINGEEDLKLGANGRYSFPTPLPTGSDYSVAIKRAPVGKKCTVMNGSGKVGTMNVGNVMVGCSHGL